MESWWHEEIHRVARSEGAAAGLGAIALDEPPAVAAAAGVPEAFTEPAVALAVLDDDG